MVTDADSSDLHLGFTTDDNDHRVGDNYAVKLHYAATAFTGSINGEFLPSSPAIRDWQYNAGLLQHAIVPLSRWVNSRADQLDWRPKVMAGIEREIRDAIRSFSDTDHASQSLTKGADSFRRIVGGLQLWKSKLDSPKPGLEQLREVQAPDTNPLMTRDSIKAIQDLYFKELRLAVDLDGDDVKALTTKCMASRRLYLVAYFVCCVLPELWEERQFQDFCDLHQRLINEMVGPSHYRQSIYRRLQLAHGSALLNPAFSAALT